MLPPALQPPLSHLYTDFLGYSLFLALPRTAEWVPHLQAMADAAHVATDVLDTP